MVAPAGEIDKECVTRSTGRPDRKGSARGIEIGCLAGREVGMGHPETPILPACRPTGVLATAGPTEGVTMATEPWSAKRKRQFAHIKEGLVEHGDPEDVAEEIAARTVNKERARSGESRTASRSSVEDISSARRSGLPSHSGAGGRTRRQLYEEARRTGVPGRSAMTKAQLERAVRR